MIHSPPMPYQFTILGRALNNQVTSYTLKPQAMQKKLKAIYCALLHNGRGDLFLYEGKKGYLTSFSIKKPDTENHVPHRILTDAIRNKGISNKIELTDVHNYEFIVEAGLGERVLVYAWIHQVDELDFLETCEIFKVSHKDLKKHWQQHASEYVTTSGKIVPLSATKAGANMSFFIRNSKHMEAAQEGIA